MSRKLSVCFCALSAAFLICFALAPSLLLGQSSSSTANTAKTTVEQVLEKYPWEYEAFFNGGFGTANRSDYSFLSVGAHAGKVLTDPHLSGLLRGQFEYDADIMPWWQGRTPKFERANCYGVPGQIVCSSLYPTGGDYNGVSITPIILRWNLVHWDGSRRGGKFLPFVQGAGGLIWTNHKFPPVGPYQEPGHQGTSVFNFTPQFAAILDGAG
jgi:lipid A 3-O-deacylase